MPTRVWLYRTAWVDDRPSATCVAVAEAWHTVSHDRLTRLLQRDGAGHPRLEVVCRTRFVWGRGLLMIDAPVLPTPLATAIEHRAWGDARQEHTPVDGLSLVLRVWTTGLLRMPIGLRLWPTGGPSPSALALAWLSEARHRRRCRPDDVLFAAW